MARAVHPELQKRKKEVTILDRYENAASVKVVASAWVDYLQMTP